MKANTLVYRSEEGKDEVLEFYNELLTLWITPHKEHRVKTSYGQTYIIESGISTAPAVILLHGTGSNSAMWIADAEALSKYYHVYAVDIIGECGNSDQARPEFSDRKYANWLNEILDALEIDKAILIACSLGGWIALDFTILFPQKTEKLILIATAGITQVNAKTILFIMLSSLFGKWGFNRINKMVYGGHEIDHKALEFASIVQKNFIPRKDLLPVFSDDELKKISCPVLFIGGEYDCFYNTEKTASRLAKLYQKSKSIILSDTGHVVSNQAGRMLEFVRE